MCLPASDNYQEAPNAILVGLGPLQSEAGGLQQYWQIVLQLASIKPIAVFIDPQTLDLVFQRRPRNPQPSGSAVRA